MLQDAASARWWFIGKLSVSLLLIAYLAVSVEWSKAWSSARGVSLAWLAISLFYIPASIVIVALRYRLLINGLVSFRSMLRLVIFQGAISTFLANAAGSLSYVGILVRLYKVPVELAVQSTIIARAGDMLSSLVVAALLVALAWRRLEGVQSIFLLAMLLSAGILFVVAMAVVAGRRMQAPLPQGAQAVSVFSWRGLLGFGMKVIRLDRTYAVSVLPGTLLHSFALQGVIALAMYFNARAFGLEIGFFEAALVGVVSSFLASVPVTVFGGLGVYEVSTVGLLALFGVPVEAGAGMILVVRALFFSVMAAAFLLVRPPTQ